MTAGRNPRASIEFQAIAEPTSGGWSRPRVLDFLDQLLAIEVGDTELLHVAHYGALAVRIDAAGPSVVLLVHRGLTVPRLTADSGAWAPPYSPMALRCLPFRVGRTASEIEFAPALCDPAGRALPFSRAKGQIAPEMVTIENLLGRIGRGRARLANAARLLMSADVLVPLTPPEPHEDARLLVVNGERMASLTGLRAAALTADANLGYELAAALLFSTRWLVKGVVQDLGVEEPPPAPAPGSGAGGRNFDEPVDQQSLLMDDSRLFSIEDFLRMSGSPDDPT